MGRAEGRASPYAKPMSYGAGFTVLPLSEECVSPWHVSMPQRDHARLEWRAPDDVLGRARPEAWTCACRATFYELRVGAGQGFIRRTLQDEDGHRVHETRLWRITEARAVWSALLAGQAR
ncbi:hypothetical protein [Streptosporangium sp. NBC_01469]|uniref:hypothetical protein n=1 Tax=Streptosporangium sp. NBC_01469 TaxID=2903898 RepID=UPI002E28A58C|nr:hypothetical protein [Streptosporangium sp. NBC_01469]